MQSGYRVLSMWLVSVEGVGAVKGWMAVGVRLVRWRYFIISHLLDPRSQSSAGLLYPLGN